jgi:hypothetical protein
MAGRRADGRRQTRTCLSGLDHGRCRAPRSTLHGRLHVSAPSPSHAPSPLARLRLDYTIRLPIVALTDALAACPPSASSACGLDEAVDRTADCSPPVGAPACGPMGCALVDMGGGSTCPGRYGLYGHAHGWQHPACSFASGYLTACSARDPMHNSSAQQRATPGACHPLPARCPPDGARRLVASLDAPCAMLDARCSMIDGSMPNAPMRLAASRAFRAKAAASGQQRFRGAAGCKHMRACIPGSTHILPHPPTPSRTSAGNRFEAGGYCADVESMLHSRRRRCCYCC